jgi:hypothetical protein
MSTNRLTQITLDASDPDDASSSIPLEEYLRDKKLQLDLFDPSLACQQWPIPENWLRNRRRNSLDFAFSEHSKAETFAVAVIIYFNMNIRLYDDTKVCVERIFPEKSDRTAKIAAVMEARIKELSKLFGGEAFESDQISEFEKAMRSRPR